MEKEDNFNYCKKCNIIKKRKWEITNSDIYIKQRKAYREKNRDKINKYNQELYKNNFNYKIKACMRARLRIAIKNNKKTCSVIKYLGCDMSYFKKWIESQFNNNMTWDNYGEWQLDHVKPCASFDLSILEQQFICFNWKNYQPLMKQDNNKKQYNIDKKLIINHKFKAFKYLKQNPIS